MGATVGAALDTALDRSVVLGYSAIGHAVRRRLPGWPADPPPAALRGKDVAVTGATSGLGTQTARELAALGAQVHLIVRNAEKGDAVARSVSAEIGRPDSCTVWLCDVADTDSVRSFTEAFRDSGVKLSGLIHNAGLLPATRQEDGRGHELTMAVHVLGPVLMTEGLRPALAGDARIVLVTSGGMYTQRLRADDVGYHEQPYRGAVAYARSKRAQVELLAILQERWGSAGAAVYATHPGWAATPGVSSSLPGFDTVMKPLLRRGDAGVDTTTWLVATDPRPAGGTLWHDRQERPTNYLARTRTTDADRHALWRWVAAETGIRL
ncbi:MAG: SDR family NAD(P)-dependent oxidoreductase [Actinomycetales bacterium]|nr:SDR family NAD(P)-dependent oxidoreductase [Actinomycetales bacterium]